MNLRILTLNCGKAYNPKLFGFLAKIFEEARYDVILLQELPAQSISSTKPHLGNYGIVRAFDAEMNVESELAIAYRDIFTLEEKQFYSFARFKRWNWDWPGTLGMLMAKFQTPQGKLTISSVHLNPLLHVMTRKREAIFFKKRLLEFNSGNAPVIFGGDFNSGLPGEKTRNNSILAPEFQNLTISSGPTVDSRHIQPLILIARICIFLGKLGIHLRMKVDHIYADKKTAEENVSSCRVLHNRVSDHSPVEVILGA